MQESGRHYTVSIPAGLFWKLYLPAAVLILLLAAAGGFFFTDVVIMPRVVGNERDVVEVPGVHGLLLEDARERFFAVGLLTEIRSREYDDKAPENAVVTQVPGPGSKVKKGRRIAVVVSRGKEFCVIPDIKNMNERQARIELKNRGFTIGDVKKVFNDKQPPESVVDAFPQCGSTISRDMKVDIVMSKGRKPTSAEMPNIVGEKLDGARQKLEECGLAVGAVNYRNDPSLLPGTVIAQSVPPGEDVPFETPIDITVSLIR